jgi:uncharacterized integral membrane protein (TIGR00698 family)
MRTPSLTRGLAAGLAPGVTLSVLVALLAFVLAPPIAKSGFAVPAMVIALLIGMMLSGIASRPLFQPGIGFCVKVVLRWAVALLGLRIALSDILALGWQVGLLVIIAMSMTLISGLLFARWLGQTASYGALSGAGTAVCGASATLATATVVPDYKGKGADVVFVVIAVNALSTLAMVLYPLICGALGFDPQATGVMLGATIHDVAQVVGAGYAVSEPVGNTAVVVKLFRVFLLLPVVVGVAIWFSRGASAAKVPVPVFAVMFLVLCLVNSAVPFLPAVMPVYAPVKTALGEASTWGLLTAIGALGLGTSFSAMAGLGWRHVANVVGTTLVILAIVTGGLFVLR